MATDITISVSDGAQTSPLTLLVKIHFHLHKSVEWKSITNKFSDVVLSSIKKRPYGIKLNLTYDNNISDEFIYITEKPRYGVLLDGRTYIISPFDEIMELVDAIDKACESFCATI